MTEAVKARKTQFFLAHREKQRWMSDVSYGDQPAGPDFKTSQILK